MARGTLVVWPRCLHLLRVRLIPLIPAYPSEVESCTSDQGHCPKTRSPFSRKRSSELKDSILPFRLIIACRIARIPLVPSNLEHYCCWLHFACGVSVFSVHRQSVSLVKLHLLRYSFLLVNILHLKIRFHGAVTHGYESIQVRTKYLLLSAEKKTLETAQGQGVREFGELEKCM